MIQKKIPFVQVKITYLHVQPDTQQAETVNSGNIGQVLLHGWGPCKKIRLVVHCYCQTLSKKIRLLVWFFYFVFFVFCSCCWFRKTRKATSDRGLARMCNSILQLGSIMQKKTRRKREPRKTEISSYAKHLRLVEKVDALVLGAENLLPFFLAFFSVFKKKTWTWKGEGGVQRGRARLYNSSIKQSQQVWGWLMRLHSAVGSVSSIVMESKS